MNPRKWQLTVSQDGAPFPADAHFASSRASGARHGQCPAQSSAPEPENVRNAFKRPAREASALGSRADRLPQQGHSPASGAGPWGGAEGPSGFAGRWARGEPSR